MPLTDSRFFACIQDDLECPLCLEEMDVSDLNFKPCPCGYQVSLDSVLVCQAARR